MLYIGAIPNKKGKEKMDILETRKIVLKTYFSIFIINLICFFIYLVSKNYIVWIFLLLISMANSIITFYFIIYLLCALYDTLQIYILKNKEVLEKRKKEIEFQPSEKDFYT